MFTERLFSFLEVVYFCFWWQGCSSHCFSTAVLISVPVRLGLLPRFVVSTFGVAVALLFASFIFVGSTCVISSLWMEKCTTNCGATSEGAGAGRWRPCNLRLRKYTNSHRTS